MKVGLFCDTFLPENKAVSVRLFHFAEAFRQAGAAVTVHTSSRQKEKFSFAVKENVLPPPSSNSGAVKRLLSELLLGAEVFLRILFSSYRLVVLSSPPFFTTLFGVCAATLRRIPYVIDVRDEYPEVYFTAALVSRTGLVGRILAWMERRLYAGSLLAITVTEGIYQRMALRVGADKVMLVRNGFDETLFIPAVQKATVFTVVFHGNIGKFQNPALILEIASLAEEKRLPIHFRVIGWGNNDTALKSANASNVSYIGMIPYKEMPNAIADAHVGLSVRSDDIISVNSFPVKLYEYIGVGLPMVVTPVSEAGQFIEGNGLGYQFSGRNAAEILEAIELLMDNTRWLQIAERVKGIRPQFSRQAISKQFVEFTITKLGKRNA